MRMYALSSPTVIGKKLGKHVYNANGNVLLAKGTVISAGYQRALLQHGYSSIYVVNELAPEIEINDFINEDTRQAATKSVQKMMQDITRSNAPDIGSISRLVGQMLNEMSGSSDVLFGLSVLRTVDDYTFVHSVNMAVISMIIGTSLHYSRDELHKLGVGAILHDLGKIKIPLPILNKPGPLDDGELKVMKTHAHAGFDILRERLDVSLFSAHVAYQHHERLDGTGYPRGVAGAEIHEFGLIGAVADFYDAVTADRVYRPRMSPLKAAEMLTQGKGVHFSPRIVEKLLARVAVYPNGTIVTLQRGRLGIVNAQNTLAPNFPMIKIVSDESQKPVEPYDLQTSDEEPILRILPDFPQDFVALWRARQGGRQRE